MLHSHSGLAVVVVVVVVVVVPFQIRTNKSGKKGCFCLEARSHLDGFFILFRFLPFPCPNIMNMSSSPVLPLVLRFYAFLFCFNVALTAEVDITTGNDLMSFVTVSVVNMRCCFLFPLLSRRCVWSTEM